MERFDLQAAILLEVTRRQSLGQIVGVLRSRNRSERQEGWYGEVHDEFVGAEKCEEIVRIAWPQRMSAYDRSKINTNTPKEIPPASYRLSALLPPRPSLHKVLTQDACSLLSLAYHESQLRHAGTCSQAPHTHLEWVPLLRVEKLGSAYA
jgi:hypothetical protein